MFDRSAGLTWDAALEILSWKEEGGWAMAKAPAASRIANPFEISCNQRFTALNPIPAPSACYETDRKSMPSLRDGLGVELRRRSIRTHRQTSFLDQLHGLRNGNVDNPALVHERLRRIERRLLRSQELFHVRDR